MVRICIAHFGLDRLFCNIECQFGLESWFTGFYIECQFRELGYNLLTWEGKSEVFFFTKSVVLLGPLIHTYFDNSLFAT